MKPPKLHAMFLLTLLACLLTGAAPCAASDVFATVSPGLDAPAGPAAAEPQIILNAPSGYWSIGGGLLYWSLNPSADYDDEWWALKRRPLAGDLVRVLATTASSGMPWTHLWADETGVFYINQDTDLVEFRSIGVPTTVVGVATPSDANSLVLASDESYFYIAGPANVRRGARDSYGTRTLSELDGVNSLFVKDAHLWMMNGSGIYRQDKSCTTIACQTGYELRVSAPNGKHLRRVGDQTYYWSRQGDDWRLGRVFPNELGGAILYTAHGAADVSPVVGNETHLFWIEMPTPTSQVMRRMSLADLTVETIHVFASGADLTQLYSDEVGVIYGSGLVYRIPYDAEAINWDLKLCDMQIVQTIQNWADTDTDGKIDLVGNKKTYVRVVGEAGPGPNAYDVEVVLHGMTVDGGVVNLPGSPLRPLESLPDLIPGKSCADNRDAQSWLFELPDSWDDPGRIQLKPELDPRGVFTELSRDDNLLPLPWQLAEFRSQPPLCAIFIPVRTHDPLPKITDRWAPEAVDRWARLWPVPAVWTYTQSEPIEELEVCWKWGIIPYPCWGPLELDEGVSWDDWVPDAESVLVSLFGRWAVTDDPDECDDRGARVHYVGMVNGEAATNANGLGSEVANFFWVRMPRVDASPDHDNFDWPWSGTTMAHESGHNWGQDHVDCGDPENVGYFPYENTCWLNDSDPADWMAYWGFDSRTVKFISPRSAADIMSYGNPRWMSDYTYQKLMPIIIPPSSAAADDAAPDAAQIPDLASVTYSAKIDGVINLTSGEGRLNWGWVYPTASLSQGILNKWQSLASPAYDAAASAAPDEVRYHIVLLDAKGEALADVTVTPQPAIDDAAAGSDRFATFSTTFADPSLGGTVVKVRLMRDKAILDELTPGRTGPTVTLTSPAANQSYSENLTIQWRATDPDGDDLRFNVQYSPDNGATWLALVTDYPAPYGETSHTLTLEDLTNLPGTNLKVYPMLIRVAASDGYHTAAATSGNFRVTNQPPRPSISMPPAGQVFQPGERLVLQGQAMDAEDGPLGDEAVSWSISPGGGFGTGASKILEGYRPGPYTLTLTAKDTAGAQRSAQVQVTVANLTIPLGATPVFDGRCNDPAYGASPELRFPVFNSGQGGVGGQGTVRLKRTSDHLWACFSGFDNAGGYPGQVGLFVDPDRSGGTAPQSNDYAFFVTQDGTPYTRQGSGGTFSAPGPAGLEARVSGNGSVWHAEMRIPKTLLNNWDHLVGMAFNFSSAYYVGPDPSPVTFHWPWAATKNNPSTFATTALGSTPIIEELSPAYVEAGSSGLFLQVFGEGLTSSAKVLWNGEQMATMVLSDSAVGTIPVARLASAGYVTVQVRNGVTDDFLSNSLTFEVRNPAPVVTAANPNRISPDQGDFTLILTGSGFVQGSVVRWNGEARPTQLDSSAQVRAQIAAADSAESRTIGVTVNNPGPGGGTSAPVYVTVSDARRLYLPLLRR